MPDEGYGPWTVTVGEGSLADCPRCGNLLATVTDHVFGFGLDARGAFRRFACSRCLSFVDVATDLPGVHQKGRAE